MEAEIKRGDIWIVNLDLTFGHEIKKISPCSHYSERLLNQIRAIDKRRLIAKIGRIHDEEISDLDDALKISLGLIEIK